MALSSLRSMARMAMRARIFSSSSPGIYGSRNNALSGLVESRGTHSRAGRAQPRRRRSSVPEAVTRRVETLPRPQQGVSRLGVGEEGSTAFTRFEDASADRDFAVMTVAASSAFAGFAYLMKHPNKQKQPAAVILDEDKLTIVHEDPAMKTDDACLRTMQFGEDQYNKAMVGEEEKEDAAMRARFADWMKKYGRTYRDEEEKALRFELFKAFARRVDAHNAEAAESGSSVRCGLNDFADWTTQEFSRMFGEISWPYVWL